MLMVTVSDVVPRGRLKARIDDIRGQISLLCYGLYIIWADLVIYVGDVSDVRLWGFIRSI